MIADTHLRAGSRRSLPEAVYRILDGSDAILHAGDVTDAATLARLTSFAPVYAVLGNNDAELEGTLPVTRTLELAGVRIGMIHDSGVRVGRAARLQRRFPDAQLVVFGHSHIPLDELGAGGQRLFNPGSPTQRRSQPHHTVGVLDLDGGMIADHRISTVD